MIETDIRALPHGIELNCRSAGERGRPVLMFLHGFPEAAFVWDGMLEHFSRAENGGWRCIAPNLRGYGGSTAPAGAEAYRPHLLAADIEALIDDEGGRLACLVAHDWGGALAWTVANRSPQRLQRLAVVNSPHAATFLRELRNNPAQQAASAYMNFFVRPDAEERLAADDYRLLWKSFTGMGAAADGHGWLDEAMKARYREVWDAGLTGPLNYYRATPLRPPTADDPAANAVELPRRMLTVDVPTLVLWGLQDRALLPGLLAGLQDYVPRLTVKRIAEATHWLLHEQPQRIVDELTAFLADGTDDAAGPDGGPSPTAVTNPKKEDDA